MILMTVFGILAFFALIGAIVHLMGKCAPCLAVSVLLLAIIEPLRVIPLGK
jgi:hypothetical protein